jgi:hypothetical protein
MVPSFYFLARRRNHLRLRARLIERHSRLQQLRLFETVGHKNRYFLSLKSTSRHFIFSFDECVGVDKRSSAK